MKDFYLKKTTDSTLRQHHSKRILVINLAGLGDIVVSSAAIKALRNQFKEGEIYFLTFSNNLQLIEHCPYLKGVFTFDKHINRCTLKTLSAIRNLKFDIAINLFRIHTWRGSLKMWFLFGLIGAKQAIGRNTNKKGFFFDKKINESCKSIKNEAQNMLDVIGLLGAKGNPDDLELWLIGQNYAIEEFFKKHNLSKDDNIICIHPGANRLSHRWSIEHFAKIADCLIEKHNARIIIVGSKRERYLAENMSEKMQHSSIIASGDLLLSDFSSLLKRTRLFITNDTGPMHIAGVLNIPMVVISGNSPREFFPLKKENIIFLRKDEDITQDKKHEHKDLNILNSINSQDVIHNAELLLMKTVQDRRQE